MAGRIAIRTVSPDDVETYRTLRLAALRDTPMAFSSSYEEESGRSFDEFRARLPDDGISAVFMAFDGAEAVGMAGFQKNAQLKSSHKGVMWGVYVAPDYRGQGLAGRLVDTVIAQARPHVILLECGVAIDNPTARRVYRKRGFVPYGIELRAICVDGVYYDEELLVLDLTA